MFRQLLIPISLFLAASIAQAENLPLADTHLHYNQAHIQQISKDEIVNTLERNGVELAVITSSPTLLALDLHRQSPDRIVPILGIYSDYADKESWYQDALLPDRVAGLLKHDHYRGIGELHLFSENRYNSVFREIVTLATTHHLPLLMHCDPAVIDSLYEHESASLVIWAHAGAYPFPPLLRDYLNRYPNLFIDLSMRNERIAPEGVLDSEWETLFMEFPERFMVGVDTFSAQRWEDYGLHANKIRHWLNQLPDDVANNMALNNARKIFSHKQAQ